MNPEKVAELIRAGLPGAQVLVQSPDNTHYSARIVAQAFVGKRGTSWCMPRLASWSAAKSTRCRSKP
jgi:hypothetical protein